MPDCVQSNEAEVEVILVAVGAVGATQEAVVVKFVTSDHALVSPAEQIDLT